MPTVPRRTFLACGSAALLPAADLRTQAWKARWLHPPGVEPSAPGVFHFRRSFNLSDKPGKLVVHVTADSRYQLFCNGRKVSAGPARGDLNHWRYETVDLAPHLKVGNNVLATVVWNDGPYAALAQWSFRTGLLLQAAEEAHEALVNTGPDWRCLHNRAVRPIPIPTYQPTGYYAIGPCERIDAALYPWGWEQPAFDDSSWAQPEVGRNAAPRDALDSPTRWMLIPRTIPAMEETPQAAPRIRKADGAAASFPFTVPAAGRARLILDQGFETCAFPELTVRGGRGARISLRYAEALWITSEQRRRKGHRDEIDGKEFIGYGDEFICDGQPRTFRTLFWRTWRYLELSIEAAAEALTVDTLASTYTGYPFARLATFDSGVPDHQKMLDIGWRTARLCAHETYMDCPYYEQLQYAGDTRIQNLVSLYMSGDARLMRNAIELLDSSRTPEGATYSRAPSVLQQYIPPFSLWWIGMVNDYHRYVDDPAFVRQMLPGVRAVLGWYQGYLKDDGLLGPMPWWNYVDWVQKWPRGTPPCEPDMMPASIHLQLVLAQQYAAGIDPAIPTRSLDAVIRKTFWDPQKHLFSEDRAHQHFSQHANVLAVLAGLVSGDEAKDLITRVLDDQSLYPCSIYFRYYLNRALVKAGLGDLYVERLQPWQDMLKEGLTTWAETDNPYSRSDCHAWGSSPNIEFFRTVLGVDSAAPGFRQVVVRPHLGKLQKVRGTIPHPKGAITVELSTAGGRRDYKVTLPPGVEGEIIWGPVRAKLTGRG
jgi:alpha-L-rhamnosidase